VVKPKPDISLAKKTGHFNLLTTAETASYRSPESLRRGINGRINAELRSRS
jgi:hypothetical protein